MPRNTPTGAAGDERAGEDRHESAEAVLNKGVIDVRETMKAIRTLAGASGKVGLMGYCLGGLMTFLTTARHAIDVGVAYHGGRTEEYLDEAPGVAGPLLMHLAEEDEFISKEAQREITSVLKDKPNITIHTYPGCSRAFARHDGAH